MVKVCVKVKVDKYLRIKGVEFCLYSKVKRFLSFG
jgi:hypothetical protein